MPVGDLSPAQWALLAVEDGWSATAGLDRFRAEGGAIRNDTWYRMYSEIKTSLAGRAGTYNEPVNRIPTASEVKQWTTAHAKGYIQQVEVLVRDKTTGEVYSAPFSLAGKTLRSRAAVLKHALEQYTGDSEEKYAQKVLGAIYTGTYQMIPNEG